MVDFDKERIEDVSLIFGGTTLQHPHADHSRLYNYYVLTGTKDRHIGFEINRNKYNSLVNNEHAISSIMIDMSIDKSGFHLAIPSSYVEFQNDNTLKTVLGNEHESFNIIKKEEMFISKINHEEFKMNTILIEKGVQFIGDFHHAGTNNMFKFTENENKDFIEKHTELYHRINQHNEVKIDDDFTEFISYKIASMPYLHKNCRFFLKTKPIGEDESLTNLNVYTMNTDVCEYTNYVPKGNMSDVSLSDSISPTIANINNIENNDSNNSKLVNYCNDYIFKSDGKHYATQLFLVRYLEINRFKKIMGMYTNIKRRNECQRLYDDFKTITNETKISFVYIQTTNNVNRIDVNKTNTPNDEWHMKIVLPQLTPETNSTIEINWLIVKKSSYNNYTRQLPDDTILFGVYADRVFESKSLIGIYFHNGVFNEKIVKTDDLNYAFKSNTHNTINSKHAVGTHAYSKFDMAMHMIVNHDDEQFVNAYVNDNGLVYASKNIFPGHEIYFSKQMDLYRDV